jgi:hypothetical protein
MKEEQFMSDQEKEQQKNSILIDNTWLNRTWRPVVAWSFVLITLFDFIIGPILYTYMLGHFGQQIQQWTPLTLQGAGLYYISIAAILGAASWGRTQEKIKQLSERYGAPPSPR